MKLLLTAFDPFGGAAMNPALEAVKRVLDSVCGVEILKLEVPTVFDEAIAVVTEAIDANLPDAVLCVGQAGGRAALTVERVAINVDDARIPDNWGKQPVDRPIREDGPAAYFSTLPIKAMVASIREAGLPAAVSNSAGTFVCNHLMYGVLYHLEHRGMNARAGFLHVPFDPSQTEGRGDNLPSMCREDMVRGIEAAIAVIACNDRDIHTIEGTIQ